MELVEIDDRFIHKSVEWHKDPVIADCVGLWNKVSDNDLMAMFKSWITDSKTKIFGISKSGDPMGYAMIKNIDMVNGCGELHITIGEKSAGGIVAYNAYKNIIKYAFNELGLNRVCTYCLDCRKDIIKIMDRKPYGFVKEGYLREAFNKNGQLIGIYIYGLLKNEFRGELLCQRQ